MAVKPPQLAKAPVPKYHQGARSVPQPGWHARIPLRDLELSEGCTRICQEYCSSSSARDSSEIDVNGEVHCNGYNIFEYISESL